MYNLDNDLSIDIHNATDTNAIITNYEFVMYDLDDDLSIDIHSEVFDKDFDEVGFEPVEIDDSDEELARTFGY